MTDNNSLDHIRSDTLNAIARTEKWFKTLLVLCGISEVVGVSAVLWLMDWSDPTHRLIFAATMLLWINLALWVFTVAMQNRVGDQRILQAIDVLHDDQTDEQDS